MDGTHRISPACEHIRIVLADPFHQHPQSLSQKPFVALPGDFVLQGEQSFKPCRGHFMGNLVLHFRRRGTGTGGVDEGEDHVVLHIPEHIQRGFKIFFRFPGKAHDDVGCDADIRNRRLQPVDQGLVVGGGVLTVHAPQNFVGAGLYGQMEMSCHLGTVRNGSDEPVRGVFGMGGHEPQTEIPFQRTDCPDNVGKVRIRIGQRQILPVGVHILSQQGDVLCPVGNEHFRFGENILHPAAPLSTSDIGDDAVGAEIVAAVHDGQPGHVL